MHLAYCEFCFCQVEKLNPCFNLFALNTLYRNYDKLCKAVTQSTEQVIFLMLSRGWSLVPLLIFG